MNAILRAYLFLLMVTAVLKYFFERELLFDILFSPLSLAIFIFSFIPKIFLLFFGLLSFLYGILSYIWLGVLLIVNAVYHAILSYTIIRSYRYDG